MITYFIVMSIVDIIVDNTLRIRSADVSVRRQNDICTCTGISIDIYRLYLISSGTHNPTIDNCCLIRILFCDLFCDNISWFFWGTGVYFGWATLEGQREGSSNGGPWKCVANVGYSPTFVGQENAEKIVEGHLIGYEGMVLVLSVGHGFYFRGRRYVWHTVS